MPRASPPGDARGSAPAVRAARNGRGPGRPVVVGTAWLLVAGLLVGAAAAGAATVTSASRSAELEQLASEADVVAAYVGKDLAGFRDVTGAWSARSQLAGALASAGPDGGPLSAQGEQDAFRLVESLRLARAETGSAFVVDARGLSVANAPRVDAALGGDFSEREWFRGAVSTGEPYVTAPYRSVTTGRPWVIAAAAPVYEARGAASRGRLLGVVVSTMPIAGLQEFSTSFEASHGTDLAVVSGAGSATPGLVLTGRYAMPDPSQAAPVLGPDGRALPPVAPAPAPGTAAGRFAAYAAAARGADGSAGRLALGERSTLVARAPVPGLPYVVVASKPESLALAGARRLATGLQAGGVVLAVLLLGAVGVWRRTVGARRAAVSAEQQRIAAIYTASPSGIVELDLDHRITGCNAAFLHLLGLDDPTGVVGRTVPTLFHDGSPAARPELVHDLVLGRRASSTSRRVLEHANGSGVPVQLDWSVVRDERGAAQRLLCIVTDVTEEAALRAELERARERAEVLWRTAPIGVVEGSRDGQVLSVNAAFADLLGYEPDELVGMPARALAAPEQADAIQADAQRLRDGDSYVTERTYLHKDGRRVPVLASATQLHDHDGDVERLVGFVVDLGELHAQREQLRAALAELEQQRRELADAQRVGRLGSFSVDPTTGAWSMSDQLYELWGHPVTRPGIDELREQVLNHTPEELAAAGSAALAGPEDRHVLTFVIFHAITREERVIVSTTEITRGPDGQVRSITGTHHDVTDVTHAERQAQQARAFFEAALVATPDYTFITDLATGAVVYGTPGKRILGITSEQIQSLGSDAIGSLIHPSDRTKIRALNVASGDLDDGQVLSLQYRARHADGSWRWLARRVTPFRRADDGRVVQVLGVVRDVTEIVEAEQRLAHSALHDTLTGLPNRRLLADRLAEALARSRDTQRDVAVIYVDLDGFKRINDALGHAAGDEVLQVTAARLSGVLRPQDTVARVGGDEFVVVLEATDRAEAAAADGSGAGRSDAFAVDVAGRMVAAVSEPILLGGRRHSITASIGVRCVRATSTSETDTAEQVLRDADTAMYDAKGHGKDGYVLFRPGLRLDLQERRRVEQVLRAALDGEAVVPPPRGVSEPRVTGIDGSPRPPGEPAGARGAGQPRLWAAFQPVLSSGGVLVSVEALCRLDDADLAPVSPQAFIDVAEETGLVRRIGAFMLDAACSQLAQWRRDAVARAGEGERTGLEDVTVAVNVSAVEAQDPGLAARVRAVLARYGLSGRDLVLELTETSLLQADDSTITSLRGLRADGVGIAIDDFGTGYASLRYLVTLPVSAVKVDRSFTAGVPHDVSKTRVVQAVAGLAHDLGLGCVVEGVETAEQRDALPAAAHQQGYLLGRPVAGRNLDVQALAARMTAA